MPSTSVQLFATQISPCLRSNIQNTKMKSVATLSCFLMLVALGSARMLLAGGQIPVTPDAKDPALIFAMKGINDYFDAQKDTAPRALVTVLEATSQVVAGAIYKYKLEVSGGANGNEICDVSVFYSPRFNDVDAGLTISSLDCQVKSLSSAGVSEEQAALHAFERKLNVRMFNVYYMRVKNQPELERETSSLGVTTFKFSNIEVAYTTCMKFIALSLGSAAEVLEDCPVDANAETKITCSATITKNGASYTVDKHQC